MSFGAVYCLYDDAEYLEISLFPLSKHLDKVIFLISDTPWNGNPSDNISTIDAVKKLCRENSHFELHQGHWANEVDQRNFGLEKLFEQNIDICFIIDNDEVYHEYQFLNIMQFIEANPEFDSYHIEWNTYWSKDYYCIAPREHYKPPIAVRVKNFQFVNMRSGITSVLILKGRPIAKLNTDKYNATIIPSSLAICFHLSYARNDAFIKRKIETFSHAPEILTNWYNDIWLKWNPEMRNLHPVTPHQYQIAVKEDFSILPDQLKTFIKKEKLLERTTSIIIPNWNSCDLLKRCLDLVEKHTSGYKVIIIDNGSKDGSVAFLKTIEDKYKVIYNPENVGFAPAINQGILASDPNSDILLLNVDAEVTPRWLHELYATMLRFPNAGMVGPLGNEVASGHQREGYVDDDCVTPNLYGYCLLILREVIEKIGLFDEQYSIGGYEDNDYGIRAKLAGYELYISAKSLVRHKAHQVYKLNGVDSYANDAINREKYLNKFFGVLLDVGKLVDVYQNPEIAKYMKLRIE
jgi:hypothetical protein